MRLFPSEFSDLANKQRYLRAQSTNPLRDGKQRFAWFPLLVRPSFVPTGIDLLEEHIAPFLRPMLKPIARKTITGMTVNFSEVLPKTVRNLTVLLNNRRAPAYTAARNIGLIAMLKSASLHKFAEDISGFPLGDDPGFQVIKYRIGDYVGPHNDHHPQDANLRGGFVDLQITLTNRGVDRQLLIHESHGYLNQPINVGIRSGVSVSYLPFWHQVTPLQAKPGQEQDAQRWLLLVSWDIKHRKP